MQRNLSTWKSFARLYVVIYLIVQATFKLSAHSSQLLWVRRNILIACSIGAYRNKVLHPRSATQFSSTRTSTANASSFLSCSNLLHLYSHVKSIGKHLNQLAEIHTFVGNIVENSLVSVALILNISNLHAKS